MTLGHFIYIPGIFLLGLLIGYILRSKVADAARNEAVEISNRRRAREARRQARVESQGRATDLEAGAKNDSQSTFSDAKPSPEHDDGESTSSSKPF